LAIMGRTEQEGLYLDTAEERAEAEIRRLLQESGDIGFEVLYDLRDKYSALRELEDTREEVEKYRNDGEVSVKLESSLRGAEISYALIKERIGVNEKKLRGTKYKQLMEEINAVCSRYKIDTASRRPQNDQVLGYGMVTGLLGKIIQ
jgi:hypothetical protein